MLINKRLNCGIRMVMEEIPYVQSAAVGVWVRAGSVDETERISGISHFIEHMLFKGTDLRSARQIAEDVDKIGGNINAFTGKEATCYYIKTLGSNLEKACDILADMFLNSRFDPEEMQKEKSVILEEMKMIEDTPDEFAQDLLSENVYRGTPLERPIIGTRESLLGISRSDILDYRNREYTRDNIVVSLAGSFDPERMCEYFEGKLAGLAPDKEEKQETEHSFAPSRLVRIKDVEQAHICLGVRGVPMDHELYYALALLNNIMGGSMSSRLFQNIREQKGLAYSVYSSSSSYVKHGMYSIYAGVASNKTEDAVRGIAEELRRLAADGVTDEELDMAKEQIKSNYIFGQENVNSRMFSNGKNILLLGRVKPPEEVIANVDRVTMDEIGRAAELITDITKYCGVVVARDGLELDSILKNC
ncbi:M16 family metallopeptidase [Bacilliculturomica massiliensis]|uniref:M16 family metallopeptidase n=1 Tax=Bacilliculturomica massiliensis TaxID=1917867 RepID=UPI0010300630|nr:pitrilysin family protein [Bacilliculturomica massiliensis]